MDERYETFEAVEERLQAIADEVAREDISLDEALGLYEEAAQLARQACALSEEGLQELYPPDEPEADGAEGAEGAEAGEAAARGVAAAAVAPDAPAASAEDGAAGQPEPRPGA
ncbi:MAG: exodeoxyribonuclease VII small subunit [Eggerthellaceae bacterium]|jgi:exonuclease VII small subunit|nr:exodeoxyribonuclease VII small subunit [Eggerthellaceae bacterium]